MDSVLVGAPLDRVARIHARLCREKRITAKSLAEELQVSARTIKRDIAFMRDRVGMPIEWDPGEHSYVYTRACETLPLLRVDAHEALALALAARLFDRWHGSPNGRMFSDLIRRIAPLFGSVVSIAVDSIDSAVSAPQLEGRNDIGHLLALLKSIVDRRVVHLRYAKPGAGRVEKRHVHPLHLAEVDDGWFLLAHDIKRDRIRTFLLTRIHSVDATDETFQWPEGFDARAYLRGCLGRFIGDKEIEVRIALDAHAAVYAREQQWHPSQQLIDEPDGKAVITLRVNHLAGVKNAVLKWGEHAKVLEPAELRDQVHGSLRRACAQYES